MANLENQTLAIDLSTSWTNSSLNLISTKRPDGAIPLNRQTLWWDEKRKTVYCFGGEKSYGNPVGNSYSTPPESIWEFTPDSNGKGSGNWTQTIGPASTQAFPSDLVRVAGGISAHDDSNAYYLGGYVSAATSPKVSFLNNVGLFNIPGMLNFDFNTLDLSNTTAGGGYASQYKSGNWLNMGAMLSAPKFGSEGVFILLGDEENAFTNITIFDKKSQTWHTQTATGVIPAPRTLFCAVAVENSDTHTLEMYGPITPTSPHQLIPIDSSMEAFKVVSVVRKIKTLMTCMFCLFQHSNGFKQIIHRSIHGQDIHATLLVTIS